VGQEIFYCSKCARRLTSADFEKGQAVRVGVKVSCTDCLSDLVASLSPQEQRDFAKEIAQRKGGKPEAKRTSTVAIPTVKSARSAPRSNPGPLLALAGVGGAIVLVAVLILTSGGSDRRPPPEPAPAKAPTEDPSLRAAREAMDRAKQAPRGDLDAQIAAWARAVTVAQGTSLQKEAVETHQGLIEMRRAAQAKEIQELDSQAAPMLDREEFAAATELFERARKRHDLPEWSAAIDTKVRGVRTRIDTLFATVRQKAVDAKSRGQDHEVKAARERVGKWQRPDLATELERSLAAIVATPADPPSDRPWKPLFDGKTLDFMSKQCRDGWEVQDGSVYLKSPNSVQTRESFGDGEFRYRFEAKDVDVVYVGVRHQGSEYYRVIWSTTGFQPFDGRTCEVIITCRGDSVTAKVNGEPIKLEKKGQPLKGYLTFNARAKYFRLFSVDVRDLP